MDLGPRDIHHDSDPNPKADIRGILICPWKKGSVAMEQKAIGPDVLIWSSGALHLQIFISGISRTRAKQDRLWLEYGHSVTCMYGSFLRVDGGAGASWKLPEVSAYSSRTAAQAIEASTC